MREILFRGKAIKSNKWAFGDYVSDAVGISHKEYLNEYGDIGDVLTYVIPETVGQYTGLVDKNGTKIFEGDILKSVMWWLDDAKNGVVTFRDGAFGFIWYRGKVEMFHPFTSVCNIEYEVIGNIYDNPELLKGEE